MLELDFARQNLDRDWSKVLFSDERSVELGAGKKQQWVFGYLHERCAVNKVSTYNKSKGPCVMAWAAIGASIGRTELIVMNRDDRAMRLGYTADSYIEALEQGLIPVYEGQVLALQSTLQGLRSIGSTHGALLASMRTHSFISPGTRAKVAFPPSRTPRSP